MIQYDFKIELSKTMLKAGMVDLKKELSVQHLFLVNKNTGHLIYDDLVYEIANQMAKKYSEFDEMYQHTSSEIGGFIQPLIKIEDLDLKTAESTGKSDLVAFTIPYGFDDEKFMEQMHNELDGLDYAD